MVVPRDTDPVWVNRRPLHLVHCADASVRMFDLRNLDHSTIIYEDESKQSLLRLACNKQDPNYLAVRAWQGEGQCVCVCVCMYVCMYACVCVANT